MKNDSFYLNCRIHLAEDKYWTSLTYRAFTVSARMHFPSALEAWTLMAFILMLMSDIPGDMFLWISMGSPPTEGVYSRKDSMSKGKSSAVERLEAHFLVPIPYRWKRSPLRSIQSASKEFLMYSFCAWWCLIVFGGCDDVSLASAPQGYTISLSRRLKLQHVVKFPVKRRDPIVS